MGVTGTGPWASRAWNSETAEQSPGSVKVSQQRYRERGSKNINEGDDRITYEKCEYLTPGPSGNKQNLQERVICSRPGWELGTNEITEERVADNMPTLIARIERSPGAITPLMIQVQGGRWTRRAGSASGARRKGTWQTACCRVLMPMSEAGVIKQGELRAAPTNTAEVRCLGEPCGRPVMEALMFSGWAHDGGKVRKVLGLLFCGNVS